MQIRLQLTRDSVTPHLARKLRQVSNALPALQTAGTYIVSVAQRAFDEPALRAADWPPLKPRTIESKARKNLSSGLLRGTGALWHSLRIIDISQKSVTVGSDRFYAKFHQLGTGRIPARPFFPFNSRGKLTPKVADRIQTILHRWLMQG